MASLGKRIKEFVGTGVAIAVIFGIGTGFGYYQSQKTLHSKGAVVSANDVDIKLPTEVEKRYVTKDEIEAKISEIGELSSYAGYYHVDREEDYARHIMDDWEIPGTTNTIHLECDGVVKVGYDISKINIRLGEKTIFVSLPQPELNDNYVIWDSVECAESNNILNPIDFAEYQMMIGDIEAEGLQMVEEQGIYQHAEDNVKVIIENYLGEFSEYEVEFI